MAHINLGHCAKSTDISEITGSQLGDIAVRSEQDRSSNTDGCQNEHQVSHMA
jgi:hypothetical protein